MPGPETEAIFDAAGDDEIPSEKFSSPEPSVALATHAFGFFLERASDPPAPPDCEREMWSARCLAGRS